ncbi:hypothetical protein G7Y79_00013g035650 [Physcia stellaris]|nr:hypothetical protein G7Y79_00013g035650 [Physcia stellaris]
MASEIPNPRSPEHLKSLLQERQAESFQNALDSLPPRNRTVLERTLTHLSDKKWNELITQMRSVSVRHLLHYTELLGAYHPQPPRECKVRKTYQNPHETADTPTELSGDELRSAFGRLPLELRHKIEDNFIKSSLAQDFFFPDQNPGTNGLHEFHGESFEPMKYEVLLGLNKATYECYSSKFWDSYFVIGPGPATASMQWLRRMPKSVQKRVQKLYISLDTIDFAYDEKNGVKFRAWELYQREKVVDDPIRLMQEHDREVSLYEHQLWKLWECKLDLLVELDLKILAIDIRNAGSIDGMNLAYEFKCRLPHCEVRILSRLGMYSRFFHWELSTYTILDLLRVTEPERFFERPYPCFNYLRESPV